jgi:FMN-dependent NADH-azoreductase
MNILHLDSSIQGDASASRALSAAVVTHLRAAHPGAGYAYRDLTALPLPHLTLGAIGDVDGEATLAEFLAADIVVIGAALYNFTLPTQLKAWIDRIVVAGRTFRYGESGPEGLAGDKRVIVALARGGVYSAGSPFAAHEHAETLLRSLFGFIGIADPEFVVAEGLAYGPEQREAAIGGAMARVGALAA